MARLRYNLVETTLATAIDDNDTTIDFAEALTEGGVDIPTIASPDYLALTIGGSEIVWLTAYTTTTTTGTILREPPGEDTNAVSHSVGAAVQHNPTKLDYGSFVIRIAASDSTARDKDAADYVCTGTADETMFQDIIDTYGATGDTDFLVVIEVASGTYQFAAGVTLDCDAGTIIRGAADSRTLYGAFPNITKSAAGNYSLFSTGNGSFRALEGLYINNDSQAEAVAAPMIDIGASGSLRLLHCAVYSYGSSAAPAVQITGNGGSLDAEYCDLEGTTNALLLGAFTSCNVVARHCYFYGDTGSAIEGTTVSGGLEVLLDDCWVDGTTNGLRLDGNTGSTPMPRVRIIECQLDAQGGEAAYLTDIERLIIIGGHWSAVGGSLMRLSNVDFGHISDVTTEYADNHGIWLLDSDDVLIEGCHLTGYANGTAATYSGIILDGNTNNCTVRGNKLRQDGVLSAAGAALYGIRVDDSTCDDNLIEGNDLRGSCTTTGNEVSDLGTGTRGHEVIMVALGDESTVITNTGNPKMTMRMPYPFCLTKVRASLTTVSSSGIPTFDINDGGTTILSTKLTIDAGEKTSTTAATAAVISDPALADDAEITFDVDVAGTGATGPKIALMGWRV